MIDPPGRLARHAAHQGEVALVHDAGLEAGAQSACAVGRQRQHQHAAGAAIEAVHRVDQAAQLGAHETDARLAKLREAIRSDRRFASAIGFRYHDGKPGIIEGLLSRGDRRVGAVIERVWRDGGRFDGWREHFSYDNWLAACEAELPAYGVDLAWYTTRERGQSEVLPWDHIDSGLDKDWLWADWQDALDDVEQDDCRWTPCFDCGVCPQLGTHIQIGPTGKQLLPLTVIPSV